MTDAEKAGQPTYRPYYDVAIGTVNGRPGWIVWGDGVPLAQFLLLPHAELFRAALAWELGALGEGPASPMRVSRWNR